MVRMLHGLTTGGKPPEYYVWSEMVRRCHNPRHPRYADYGGRGVAVCDRWRKNFSFFIADMGWRPDAHLTLDRIDNERGYEPGNCRWTDVTTQNQNRRNIIAVEHGGERVCLKEYCRRTGRKYGVVMNRMRRGWNLQRALETVDGRRRKANQRAIQASGEALG